jgi:uncharacterized protein (DUF433 family)
MGQINDDWRCRIKVDATIHHGDPCIAGTRLPVSTIVNSIADGDTFDEILQSYPQISKEDIQAALYYAAEQLSRPLTS